MMLTEELKKLMSAFLNNQKLPAIIVGTYDGSVRVNEVQDPSGTAFWKHESAAEDRR